LIYNLKEPFVLNADGSFYICNKIKTEMSNLLKLLILMAGILVFDSGCADSANLGEDETAKEWTKEELVALVEQYISEDLKQLGEPPLKRSVINDTMFVKEYYEREKIINDRNLENKDYRYKQAVSRANDASALLQQDPNNEEAKAIYKSAQDKINSIDRSVILSDSLAIMLEGVDEKAVFYYELVLSYDGTDEKEQDINFLARVGYDGEIKNAGRTRKRAESKERKQ
jgi:hypothetical protein